MDKRPMHSFRSAISGRVTTSTQDGRYPSLGSTNHMALLKECGPLQVSRTINITLLRSESNYALNLFHAAGIVGYRSRTGGSYQGGTDGAQSARVDIQSDAKKWRTLHIPDCLHHPLDFSNLQSEIISVPFTPKLWHSESSGSKLRLTFFTEQTPCGEVFDASRKEATPSPI
jgi:hypothetical protein